MSGMEQSSANQSGSLMENSANAMTKRKRQENHASDSSSRPQPRMPALDFAAAASPDLTDSPLQSPSSSTGQQNLHASNIPSNVPSNVPSTAAAPSTSRRASTRITRRRNIDRVQFGQYDIKTWYYSPYQFDEEEWAAMTASSSNGPSSAATSQHPPLPRQGTAVSATTASIQAQAQAAKPGGALSTNGDKAPVVQAQFHQGEQTAVATSRLPDNEEPAVKSIWICDGCFKYMRTYSGFRAHKRDCTLYHPPGKKVYQRGAHTIWQVDGARQKLYAQNLSLFGKLFIDHKTIYFDVEPFVFYVLTDATSSFDHVLGYFSKEKISYDDYNLACIITFPPYQKKGFGTLMIEFSYYLASLTSVLGTPERPLSDLGLKGYLSFWSAVALRTLALLFNVQDVDVQNRLLPATFNAPTKGRYHAQNTAVVAAAKTKRQRLECVRLRRILLGLPAARQSVRMSANGEVEARATASSSSLAESFSTPSFMGNGDGKELSPSATRRVPKGWAGEVSHHTRYAGSGSATAIENGAVEAEMQTKEAFLDVDGEKLGDEGDLTTTLERLAQATNLRIEDLCFALSECGLLCQVAAMPMQEQIAHEIGQDSKQQLQQQTQTQHCSSMQLLISRAAVFDALTRLNVRPPVMDVNYVLI